MDSSEKRRLNKLLRKPSSSSLGKALGLRQKLSRNSQKQAKCASVVSEKVPKQEINVDVATLCAEMCGVSNLSQSAANLLQKHLNQIARLLIHEVLRVMEQSRRGVPQASDIDLASVLIGLESPFGTTTANFLPIRTGGRTASSGPGGKVFFIRPDKEIDVKALLLREPAGVIYDVSLVAHWLSVNGKQPTSPQNPPPDFLAKMALLNNSFGSNNKQNKRPISHQKNDDINSSVEKHSKIGIHNSNRDKLDLLSGSHPRKVLAVSVERRPHEISQEVMIYFRELTEACVGANETRRHEALDNATLDPGLQPILPHLMTFITEGVRINVTNHNLAILIYLMRLVKALIDNPHISLEPYLHLLVPTVITCVLNRQLCAKPITDNHWALRDFAAKQLVTLCNRHNTSSNELYGRVTRELSRALCSWMDGGSTSNSSTETCIKLSNPNVPVIVKSELSKYAYDEKSDETKLCKYESDRLTSSLTNTPISTITTTTTTNNSSINTATGNNNTNNNNGPSLGSAIHSMNTLYGIIVALAEFGAQCLRMTVFPLLSSLCHRLTKLTESNHTMNELNELNTSGSNDLKPTQQQQHPVLSLSLGVKLLPVDQRSFDFLKVMMTNRIAPLLNDWRIRQGLGVTLEDYRASYECMAECLFVMNQGNTNTITNTNTTATTNNSNNVNTNIMSITSTTTTTTTTITTTAINTSSTQLIVSNPVSNPTTNHGTVIFSSVSSSAPANNPTVSTITSNNNNNNNNNNVNLPTSTSIIVTSNITTSNMNVSNN
ncbi:unnamed protein product [Schistosoma rodhaini]|uniref:Histone H4 n=1 Tax=Schistosoma mansoni TaxID=6183 RepID=A0A3Q0KGP2_SCHMA|nr:unnamed protein product [Schistosoma rodhaini]